jgi:hypothetical protein
MTNTEVRGSKTTDSWNWNHDWGVSELAAVRGAALSELGQDDRAAVPGARIDASFHDTGLPDTTPGRNAAATSTPPFAPDQLASDFAEIERAVAALRRVGPALEPPTPETPASIEFRASRSIWPQVCVIWLTAASVVTCAIGALALLFG